MWASYPSLLHCVDHDPYFIPSILDFIFQGLLDLNIFISAPLGLASGVLEFHFNYCLVVCQRLSGLCFSEFGNLFQNLSVLHVRYFFCGGVICFLRLFEVISDILKTYELYFPNIYPKIIDLIFEILELYSLEISTFVY